jgi:hypothetical protein
MDIPELYLYVIGINEEQRTGSGMVSGTVSGMGSGMGPGTGPGIRSGTGSGMESSMVSNMVSGTDSGTERLTMNTFEYGDERLPERIWIKGYVSELHYKGTPCWMWSAPVGLQSF